MVRKFVFALAVSVLFPACDGPAEPVDILAALRDLPGVTVTEIEPYYGYPRAFQLDITQPVNHDDPNGQQFTQRAYLSHVDEDMPMVFAPSGYGTGPASGQEIAAVLGTNTLNVTHRYFIDAQPDPLDWRYLTVEQSAADHHRIVEQFKEIYAGPWVSAGISKGGETVLFHRRFYPDDVDATVAYVAPFVFGTADPRFIGYLQSIGDETCRQRVQEFQREVLQHRDDLLDRFAEWFPQNGYQFTREVGPAFESAVLTYDWTFWQYHLYDCSEIPTVGVASYDDVLAHLADVVRFNRLSDELRDYFLPYVYQAFTQIGYPARTYQHLEDLLLYDWEGNAGEERFAPLGVELVYDPNVVVDVYRWLQTQGSEIVYIYGSIDPWTGGAVERPGLADVVWTLQPGGDHRVRIQDLDERQLVYESLERWLDVDLDVQALGRVLVDVAGPGEDLVISGRF